MNDRQVIYRGLMAIAQSVPEEVVFLVTPTMRSIGIDGSYLGFLNQELWDRINEIAAG